MPLCSFPISTFYWFISTLAVFFLLRKHLRDEVFIDLFAFRIKTHDPDHLDASLFREESVDLGERDARGALTRETVSARADGGKSDAAYKAFDGQLERVAVTRRQKRILMVLAVGPHRPDSMNDPGRLKLVAARDLGVARFTAAQRFTLFQKRGTRRFVDGPVDARAAQKGLIRRVHDRVHAALRDVPLNDGDALSQCFFLASFKTCPILADRSWIWQ